MAVVMQMEWPGISAERYDEVREGTKFETEWPSGGIFHVAAIDGDVLRITDVWESEDAFNAFVETRLMPFVVSTGITSEPHIKFYEAINVFNLEALAVKQ
jgi:hypothetical protein